MCGVAWRGSHKCAQRASKVPHTSISQMLRLLHAGNLAHVPRCAVLPPRRVAITIRLHRMFFLPSNVCLIRGAHAVGAFCLLFCSNMYKRLLIATTACIFRWAVRCDFYHRYTRRLVARSRKLSLYLWLSQTRRYKL